MKVLVFRGMTDNTGTVPNVTLDPPLVRSYKLSNLYERYFEYMNLLAAQDWLRLMKNSIDESLSPSLSLWHADGLCCNQGNISEVQLVVLLFISRICNLAHGAVSLYALFFHICSFNSGSRSLRAACDCRISAAAVSAGGAGSASNYERVYAIQSVRSQCLLCQSWVHHRMQYL